MTQSSPAPKTSGSPQQVGYQSDPRFEDIANASWWQMAARLPHTLAAAARLGWAADRPAMLWLGLCQLVVAVSSAVALGALPGAMSHLFAGGKVADRVAAATGALIVVAVATGVRAGADAFAVYASARLAPEVATEADLQILAATPEVELEAYDRPGFTDRLQAAGKGAEATENLIGDAQALVSALAQLIAAAGVLTVLHPLLLPLLLLAVVPKGAAAITTARIQHRADYQNISDNHLRYLLRYYSTDRRTAAEVRATTMSGFLASWYRQITDRIKATHRSAAPRVLCVTLLGAAASGLMLAATWAALGWLAATGRMELAVAATAVIAVRTSTGALTSLVMVAARLFRTSLYLEDWQAFLRRAKALRAVRGTKTLPAAAPAEIRAENVTYTYPGAEDPAVDGVSLTLRQGELIALVGENGSGKTTLSALLTGLRVASSGSVAWDGVDLAEADPHSVWARVGLVPQDYTRWPMDLRSNIHLGQPRTEDDALLLQAARAAGADSVIAKAPYGLDTLVASSNWGGTDLSGGQWQRIAVARAFYRDAAMLMLDEPTSAMDPRAEHLVISRFKELAAGKAAIFVTHNLENARIADRIMVLDGGRVREEGDFQTLLDLGGVFAELYKLAQDR
ncbi:ATP-binding cassette, subfamily B [Streptomyces sp. SceaMP-e96]|uniref:ATP-binding cassette domain-containing protein n=1 Tax=unclassified Streptomyces TaxID=2593676 RepID=UPI000823BD63|nr:ATP-binding cassette domain-containing protein [Streptomyces sp. SceaMP-e96]MYT16930.1 ATP-binding cassette domain-containing protein [Streptomyces sp. SID4951]SCK36114.1 ATP-binding cassette, subfamily B [Streptomyces sp. SceaMP-e96]